jgi:hypothetical protein
MRLIPTTITAAELERRIYREILAERKACAEVARCYRNGNPDAVARIDWTATQIANAIEARGAADERGNNNG